MARLLAFAVVLVLTCCCGSAAAVPLVGLELTTGSVPTTGENPKTAPAFCPPGKVVVGAGGDVTPGNGDVLIESIRPGPGLQSVGVRAAEDEDGTLEPWYVQAWAICAYPPPGLQLVTATSPSTSAGKSVTATCPAGKRLLGTGAELIGGSGQVLLDGIRPDAALTKATANAWEDETRTSASWSIRAHAICASGITGLQRVALTTTSDSTNAKNVISSCPADKRLVGTGGEINTGGVQGVLDAIYPINGLTTSGAAAFEDDTGNPGNWSMTSYSICAAYGNREHSDSGFSVTEGNRFIFAGCAGGVRPVGVGGELIGAFGHANLVRFEHQTRGGVPVGIMQAHTHPTWAPRPWMLRVIRICRTPLPVATAFVRVDSAFSSDAEHVAHADCPSGMRVVHAGGGVAGDIDGMTVDYIRPNPGLTSIDVFAHEMPEGNTGGWVVAAEVLCAAPLPGRELVTATSDANQNESKTVTARCPAGKTLLGFGGGVTPSTGGVVLDDLRPDVTLTSVDATGVAGPSAAIFDWSITAHAICATT